jgi:acyl-CoA synthetase (AMP-forming)/AMP-acid ligase II
MDPASSSASSRMHSPSDWIARWADEAPERIALWLGDGSLTYGEFRDLIHARTRSAIGEFDDGEVVPTLVRLDLASIVEVFALSSLGAVPIPSTTTPFPTLGAARAPGAVIAVATSGSSGAKRVVPLTMANLASSVEASRLRLGTGADDRWLLTLPIDHIAGLSVLFRTFEAGGTAIVSAFGSDTARIIDRTRPTVASLVPTMVYRLLETDASSLARYRDGSGRRWAAASLGRRSREGGGGRPRRDIRQHGDVIAGGHDGARRTDSTTRVRRAAPRRLRRGHRTRRTSGDDRTGTILVDGPAVYGGYLGERHASAPIGPATSASSTTTAHSRFSGEPTT